MSDESRRLDRIDQRLDRLEQGLGELGRMLTFLDRLEQGMGELGRMLTFLDRIEQSMAELGRMQNILREEVRVVVQRPGQPGQAGAAESGESALVREYVAASRMRELYPTDLFPGLERVSMPVGAIHEESQHLNQVDLLYVAAIAKLRGCRRMF